MVCEWPDAGNNSHLVCFDLHAATAAEPLLAAPQFMVDAVHRDGNSGGHSGQRGDKAFAMAFPGGLKT